MLDVVWYCRRELGLVKRARSLLWGVEMSEFVCHLLEHRSRIIYGHSNSCAPLEVGKRSKSGERAVVVLGQEEESIRWASGLYVGEFSDCAIVLDWLGHLRGDKAEVKHFHIFHSLKKSLSDSTNRSI